MYLSINYGILIIICVLRRKVILIKNNKRRIISIFGLLILFVGIILQNNIVLANKTTNEGILRVGMEVNYAPFNWSQPNGSNEAFPVSNSPGEYANGYDVQIAKLIAEGLGLELEIIKIDWDGLIPALQSGKIHE